MFIIKPHLSVFLCLTKMVAYFLLAGGEVDSDARRHCFGVSKEGVKTEGELLQIFSFDVAKCRLRIRHRTPLITIDIQEGFRQQVKEAEREVQTLLHHVYFSRGL